MTRQLCLLAGIVVFCATGCTPPAAPLRPTTPAVASPAQAEPAVRVFGPAALELATERKLAAVVPAMTFQDCPLADAFAQLAKAGDVAFFPNWAAMEAGGVKRSTAITLQLPETTLSAAIESLLIAAAGKDDPLDYAARHAGVEVSTAEDINRRKFLRIYDARMLFSRPRTQEPDQLMDLIRTTCLPDTWAPTGDASIHAVEGVLVVYQSAPAHRMISRLLDRLANVLSGPVSTQPGEPRGLFD